MPILVYFYLLCNNKNYKKPSGFLRAEPLSSYFEDRKGYREGNNQQGFEVKKLLSDKNVFPSLTTAPVNDEAKKHNENLPGMGGVFNVVNLHVYHYAGYSQRSFELYNPIKYLDPDGRVLWWQFADGVLQTFGGTAEAVAGACTVETGIGAFVFGWGLKDVGDGLLKISFALKDDEFSGMIPEAAGNVAESLGASDKTVEIVKDSTGLAEGAIGVGMGNIKTVSTGIKGLDTAGTAASAGSFTISVFSTLKNIFFSPDKPKETTFGNILGRYLNWQEHEKKYGNIYNPRYENMKETLKQDINRELSNSNISNKNRASYESMLRKLGD